MRTDQNILLKYFFFLIAILVFMATSCNSNEESNESDDLDQNCVKSDFFINQKYTDQNGATGPPFPLVRYRFCVLESRNNGDRVAFDFEMYDTQKTKHATFGQEFTEFQMTDSGGTAKYVHSTIEVVSDFAQKNALSKWLNCRDQIRTRKRFEIDSCFEIHREFITKIAPDSLEGVTATEFPCGINVGPDNVRDNSGDDTPASIYSGQKGSLVGSLTTGDNVVLETHQEIEGIFGLSLFIPDTFVSYSNSATIECSSD